MIDMGVSCHLAVEFPTPQFKTQFLTQYGDWDIITDTEVEAYCENTRSLPEVEEFVCSLSCDSDDEFIFQFTIEDITTTRFIVGGIVTDELERCDS